MAQALLTPAGAVTYAAAIIRQAQDAYAKQGLDVRNRPAILTSLYNLGNYERHARESKAARRLPKPNYFGFFVGMNVRSIEKALERGSGVASAGRASSPHVTKVSPQPHSAVVANKATSPKVVTSKKGSKAALVSAPAHEEHEDQPYVQPVKIDPHWPVREVLHEPVTLFADYPHCSTAGPGKGGEYNKIISRTESLWSVTAQGPYKVMGRGMDCDLSPWTLIQTDSGHTGWIGDDDLAAATLKSKAPASKSCAPSDACLAAVGKAAGEKDVLNLAAVKAGKSALLHIKLVGGKSGKEVNFKKFNPWACLMNGYNSRGGGAVPGGKNTESVDLDNMPVSVEKAKELEAKIKKVKLDIQRAHKIEKWEDSNNNPYKRFFWGWGQFLSNCPCRSNLEDIENFLKRDFAKETDVAAFLEQMGAAQNLHLVTMPPPGTNPGVVTSSSQGITVEESIKAIDEACADLWKAIPELQKKFKEVTDPVLKDATLRQSRRSFYDEGHLQESCAALEALVQIRRGHPKECPVCQLQLSYSYTNSRQGYQGHGSMSLSMDEALSLFQTDAEVQKAAFDKMQQLEKSFDNLKMYSGRDSDEACTYDPFASSQRLAKVMAVSCVEKAYVPDLFLMKANPGKRGRLFHMDFLEDDRFAVQLKNSCNAGVSARKAAAPRRK